MKKSHKVLIAAFAVALIGLNLSKNVNAQISASTLLSNVIALQASAGEAWCDTTTQNTCTISSGGNSVTGLGQPHLTW